MVIESRAQLAASEGARTASVEGALAMADATLRLIAIAQLPVADRADSLAASLARLDDICKRDLKVDCKGYQATPLEPLQWQSDPPCLRVELKKSR